MDDGGSPTGGPGAGAKGGFTGVRPSVHSARVFEEAPHVVTIGDRIRVVVHLLDASSRSILVDADDTVEAVLAAVTQRLSFADPWLTGSYAGLHECMDGITLQRPLRKDRKIGEVLQRWPKGSLAPGQEPPKLVYGFAAITESLLKSTDPKVTYFIFIQCVYHVISGIYPCSAEEAIFLGALQLQARFGSHDPSRHKPGYFAASLQGLIPAPLFSGRKPHEWEQDLILRYAHLREEARASPQRWYLNRLRAKDYFGCSFFTVAQQFSGMLPSTLQIGVSSQGITLFDLDTRSSLERYPLSSLYRWGCRKAGKVFFFQIKDAAGDQGACLEFHTKASAAVADLLAMYAQLSLLEFGFVPWEPDRTAPSKPPAASSAVAGAGGAGAGAGAGGRDRPTSSARKTDGERDRDRDRRPSSAAGGRASMVGAGLLGTGGTPGAAEAARGSLAAYRSTAGTGEALLSSSRRSLIGGLGAGAGAGAGATPPGPSVSSGPGGSSGCGAAPPMRLQVPLSAALAAAAASGADVSPAFPGGRVPGPSSATINSDGGMVHVVPPLPLAPLALAPAVGVSAAFARPSPPAQPVFPSASASAVPASALARGGMAVNPLSAAAQRANAAASGSAPAQSAASASASASASSPPLKPSSSPSASGGASVQSGSARQLLDGFALMQPFGSAQQHQQHEQQQQQEALSPQLPYHQTHATMAMRGRADTAAPWKPSSSIAGVALRRKRAQTGTETSRGGGGATSGSLALPVEIKACSGAGRAALRAAVRSVGKEEGTALAAAAAAAGGGVRGSGFTDAGAGAGLSSGLRIPSHGSFFGSGAAGAGTLPFPPGTPSSTSTGTATGGSSLAGSPRPGQGTGTGHSKPPLPTSPRPPAPVSASSASASAAPAASALASVASGDIFRPPLPPGVPPVPVPALAHSPSSASSSGLQPPLPRDPRPGTGMAGAASSGLPLTAGPPTGAGELRLASGKVPLLPLGGKPPPPPRKASASAPSTMRGSTASIASIAAGETGGAAAAELEETANRLSVKLQALARGNRVRQMLHAQYAAIRIQARWRGYSSRSKSNMGIDADADVDAAAIAGTADSASGSGSGGGGASASGNSSSSGGAGSGSGARLPSLSAPSTGGRASKAEAASSTVTVGMAAAGGAGMSAAGAALLGAAAPARTTAPSWKPTR